MAKFFLAFLFVVASGKFFKKSSCVKVECHSVLIHFHFTLMVARPKPFFPLLNDLFFYGFYCLLLCLPV
jgi:hypothetical protein